MKRKYAIMLMIVANIILMLIVFNASKNDVSELSNKNASEEAIVLYDYIVESKGENVVSGQQESTWMGSFNYENNYIFEASGKLPVIRGFDYMNDDFDGVNKRAQQWWKKGGVVTICWHCGSDFSGEWKDCMESEVPDWNEMLKEGTEAYDKMIIGMDKAAAALKKLEEKGIPVLWRPFHEFDGNWFWWSKGGADNFKKLWRTMYERYTGYWKLNNLIWVLGFSDQGKNIVRWYPGDKYCDIIGVDTYSEGNFSALYNKVNAVTPVSKPVCLHECGKNPTVSELEDTEYCWFMTWHTNYLTESNTKEEIRELYSADNVITLDEFISIN